MNRKSNIISKPTEDLKKSIAKDLEKEDPEDFDKVIRKNTKEQEKEEMT